MPPSATYVFSWALKGTLTLTVAPGVSGTPAKFKPAENAGSANASHATNETSKKVEIIPNVSFIQPNENKLSDGGRERVALPPRRMNYVRVWKSFFESEAHSGPPPCSRTLSEFAPSTG